MSNYSAQYENYYNSLLNKNRKSTNKKAVKARGNRIIRRIIIELSGSLFLFTLLIISKGVNIPGIKTAYNFSREYTKQGYSNNDLVNIVVYTDYNKIQKNIISYFEQLQIK